MTRASRAERELWIDRPHVLREYALLADGERGIVVGPRGDYVWMCFPGWDSGGVFSSLIGGSGAYAITPRERCVWGGYYEPGSLIWRSRWVTDAATIECREALALPSDRDRAVILRRVLAREGTARVSVILNPRGDFGERPMRKLSKREDGAWAGELEEIGVRWTGGQDAEPKADGHRGKALTLSLTLEEGESHDFVLVLARNGADREAPDPDSAWQGVESEWHDRIPKLESTAAPRDARHAYAVLAGLTSSSGGMVAAATTSLPERARGGRSYDYRFAWIRDQTYAGQAAAKAGPFPLMDDAVRFVAERLLEDGPRLKPAYTTRGGAVPDQRRLSLPGYPGGTDIVGNWVNEQFQLDAFGEALLLFAAAAGHDHLEADGWRAAEAAVEAIAKRWREPDTDAGIWEIEPDAWTHSRLICAAGLRRIAACGPPGLCSEEFDVRQRQLRGNLPQAFVHALLLECAVWQKQPPPHVQT